MKKKVTQETAHRLRELLEKVTSERGDAAPLPKNHQIARLLLPLFALCFAGVYLQNAHAFSIIGGAFATIFEVGVWETFEFVVTVTSFHFWTWSVPLIVLGAVFFLETLFLQEGIQCFSGTCKGRDYSLEKETTRDKSHPCKRARRLSKIIANGISI